VSYASVAPSLAQTVISLFQPEADDGTDADYDLLNDVDRSHTAWLDGPEQCDQADQRMQCNMFSRRAWRRYFRPLTRKVYYMALFHLLVLNFPYALAAWIYLFVFTLVSVCFCFHHSFIGIFCVNRSIVTPSVGGPSLASLQEGVQLNRHVFRHDIGQALPSVEH
jgi:hypothetical protein